MAKLVIFVKTSRLSVDLLKYVDKNIAAINAKGVTVSVEKISGTSNKECKRLKITRLPAMVDEQGRVHIGVEKIMAVFKRNIGSRHDDPLESMYGVGENTPESDVNAYLARQMFDGDGRPIVTGEDSEEGESKDFAGAFDQFRSKSTTKRKSILPPAPRRGGKKARGRRERERERDESDESGSDDDGRADVVAGQTDADVEEEMREQMVRAWRDGGN